MSVALPLPRAAQPSLWRTHLVALGAAWAAILVLFHRDAATAAAIWWNSSTFNHCLLIPPLIAWLVWQRLPGLRQLSPAAWAPGLIIVGIGALAWLLGDAGSVALGRHLGLLLMLQGAVVACLGKSVARGLLFPICFAFFLLPAGEEIVPLMQTVTARIATALLGLAGGPAYMEGIFITTPAGYFEVAEACAGVKFLIAMAALGALVANVCFHSWPRRIAFLAVALVVPILANGVRAWGTIYIAGRTGLDFAASLDHVIYGGIFFAIVIALILAAGWPWFDRGVDDPWFDPQALQDPRREGRPVGFVVAALLIVAALPLGWSATISAAGTRPVPAAFALPDIPGWPQVARDGRGWRPDFAGADLFRIARYRDREGRTVDLAIAVYARQYEGHEVVGFGQGAAEGWAWAAPAPAPPNGRAERIASHGLVREVVSFYRVGDTVTGSGMRAKLETIETRLLGGPQRAVALLVSAPEPATGISPRPMIDAFLAALGPVDRLADRAAGIE